MLGFVAAADVCHQRFCKQKRKNLLSNRKGSELIKEVRASGHRCWTQQSSSWTACGSWVTWGRSLTPQHPPSSFSSPVRWGSWRTALGVSRASVQNVSHQFQGWKPPPTYSCSLSTVGSFFRTPHCHKLREAFPTIQTS